MATITTLVNFNGTDGAAPYSSIIADASGNLFATTSSGGVGDGMVVEIPYSNGTYATTATVLVTFNGTDGANPMSGLIMDAAGNLFGTTSNGGITGVGFPSGYGTVFELRYANGSYASTPTTLVSFNGTDGAYPVYPLIADAAGNLFGTTAYGGANGDGSVFEIPYANGSYASTPTTLLNFGSGKLIFDAAGNLFGTTLVGGINNDGTVFELPLTNGSYAAAPTTLVSFNGANGQWPGSLMMDSAGNLFGASGGPNTAGTVFEIPYVNGSYAGTPTTIVSFNYTDGASPDSLIMDAAGNLFGTTAYGGINWFPPQDDGDGTVFEIPYANHSYASAPTTLVNFVSTLNGAIPTGGLRLDANGNLFGTTVQGGSHNNEGTAFEITQVGVENPAPSWTWGQLDSVLSSLGFVASTRTQIDNFLIGEGFFPNPLARIVVDQEASPPLDPTTQFAILTASTVTVATNPTMKFVVDSTAGSALTVTGSADVGVATGAGDNQVMLKDTGNDTVYLGPGNNTVYGGAGSDSLLVGGTGLDLLVAGTGGGVLRSGTTAPGQANSLNDATSTAHTLYGGGGKDSLYAVGSGNDSLVAGSGDNALYGYGTGANTLDAGGTSGNDSLYGGDGHDSLVGGLGLDLLVAGAGTGVLRSGSGAGGANSLNDNTTSAHTLYGAAGNDSLYAVGSGSDVLISGSGNQMLSAKGSTGNDSLYAVGSGNDVLIGGTGNQVLNAIGGTGHNSLQATGGNDTLYAGSGGDTLDASGSTANVLFWSGAAGNDTMKGSDAANFFDVVHDVAGQKIDITGSALASFNGVGFVDSGRALADASYDVLSNPGHVVIGFSDGQQVTVDANIYTLYFTDGTKII